MRDFISKKKKIRQNAIEGDTQYQSLAFTHMQSSNTVCFRQNRMAVMAFGLVKDSVSLLRIHFESFFLSQKAVRSVTWVINPWLLRVLKITQGNFSSWCAAQELISQSADTSVLLQRT